MTDQMKSFVKGTLLGLVSRAEFPQGKEPVAYLYNRVRLPKLPEWDRVAYPYAMIFDCETYEDLGTGANLALLPEIKYYNGTLGDGTPYTAIDQTGMRYFIYEEYDGDTAWGEVNEFYASIIPYASIHWAGFDVYDADGGLVISASEPVPVYE